MNKITLMGRLGADPEFRYAASGTEVVKFKIATDDGWGDRKETNWHSCVCFGKRAKVIGDYFRKGSRILLTGRVSYRKWEKDDGTSQWFTDVIVEDFEFVDKRQDGGQRAATPQQAPAPNPSQFDDGGFAMSDDDIPF